MRLTKKSLSVFMFTALAMVMLIGAGGVAYGQSVQKATLTPDKTQVGTGESLAVTVGYDASAKVMTFGIKVFFNSQMLNYVDASYLYDKDHDMVPVPLVNDDTDDLDANATTDKLIVIGFTNFGSQFPTEDTPLDLLVLNFTATTTEGDTLFNVVSTATPIGFDFEADTGGTITVGTSVTPKYLLTTEVTGTGTGNITRTPDATEYAAGDTIELLATATTGEFVIWSNGDTANPTTITMEAADMTVNATINLAVVDTFTLTLSAGTGGKATANPVGPVYNDGTVVSLTATPDSADYEFASWTGDVADSSVATTTVTMDANKTVTANFNEIGVCNADATFTATKNGLTVTFNVSSSVQQTLSFDYGDGTSGAATTHTYTTAGEYDVDLTATISDDCTDEVSLSVTVTDIDPCADYEYGYGDYDQDDEIDIFDALGIAMHVVEIQGSVITDPCHLDALDVDENGKVDIDDALAIARFDVQLDCYCVLNP